ncbi:Putative glycosyltransferase EpsF [Photobacterium piscicola]|uniref:Putative glycosyltransferase EpsF n=1 Tax=Photobacterium piscicola TaxID=1378299 RepID=A0A1T5HW46_9GAMM|nr:glycosyltransferase [Photobacterium piscicola]SKC30953.1 Putative glycosyltransferase EpsF [Photobacterium piscicola]
MKKNNKRIIHVITGLGNGGAEGVLFRLINETNKEIEHVVVSITGEGKYGKYLKDIGCDIYTLNAKRSILALFISLPRLIKIIYISKPDVVQTWMYHADIIGGVAAKFCRVKKIYWGLRHTDLTPTVNSRSTLIAAKVCALFSYFIPNKIVTCSLNAVSNHIKVGYRDIFHYIPNGLDINRYSSSEEKRNIGQRQLKLDNSKIILGCVARYHPQKNHVGLINAFSNLKNSNIQLLLVGSGCTEDNEKLVSLIKSNEVSEKVSLVGEQDDISMIMNVIDILILSSFGEGFPNVIAEAMSTGKIIVTTDVGDSRHIIGKMNVVCKSINDNCLYEGMKNGIAMYENMNTRKEIQKYNESRVKEKYSLPRMCDSYVALWRSNE